MNVHSLVHQKMSEPDQTVPSPSSRLEVVKQHGYEWIKKSNLGNTPTVTKPGTIAFLLFGTKLVEQSIKIKLGRLGEEIAKKMISISPHLELLTCGVQKINTRRKDVDLLFMDKVSKKIYYRELKGNIELDTEKLPATVEKCKEIETHLKEKYPEYTIHCGILNWTVYNREILTTGISNIRAFEKAGVIVEHMSTFLDIVELDWSEDYFYAYFRKLGDEIIGINQ
jgi:hypothetical protein